MDWSQTCGSPSLVIWSNGNVGKCFSYLAFSLPSSLILTAISSYYIGKEYNWIIRNRCQSIVLNIRALICVILSIVPISSLIVKCHKNIASVFLADFIVPFVACFAWLVHALYISILKKRVSRSLRGPLPSLIAWLLTVVPCIFQLRSYVVAKDERLIENPEFWLDVSYAILEFLYLVTLIPSGIAERTGFDRSFQSFSEENLSERFLAYNNRFASDVDPFYLGVAREGVTFLSRLLLSWVQPLMSKGNSMLTVKLCALLLPRLCYRQTETAKNCG